MSLDATDREIARATPVDPSAVPDGSGVPEWERRWPPASYIVRATAAVALTLLTISAARSASGILVMVVIAAVLAIGMDPWAARLQRRGLARGTAVAAVILSVVAVSVLFALLILPPLARQIAQLADDVPAFASAFAVSAGLDR
jgi:predicted PurR-regulated permease PerM